MTSRSEWSAEVSQLDDPNVTAQYLLARFKQLGAGFLHGMYSQCALVLIDTTRGQVWLGRDPTGERRVFFSEAGGCLRSSTQLVALRALLDHPKLDRSWEDFFLAHEFLPGERTHYHGVRSLSPVRC